jgi:hypothetical protein
MSNNPEDDREIDAYDAYINEGGANFGKLLKFVKGEYFIGEEEVEIGTQYAALVFEERRGWVKFVDGKPVDYRIGLVRDGYVLPSRESLGDNDPAFWPTDKKGNPQDIWVKQAYLPILDIESDEVLCFVTGSQGGDQALRGLMRDYKPKARTSEVPIISLQSDSYAHDIYGRVFIPVLKIVGWHDLGTVPPPPVKMTAAQLSVPAAPLIMQQEPKDAEQEEDPITTGPQPQPAKKKGAKTAKAKAAKTADNSDMGDNIPF